MSGSTGKNRFGGNLCKVASTSALSDLHISGGCYRSTSVKTRATPYGPLQTVTYQARWGAFGSVSAPTHHASVAVVRVDGPDAVLAYYAQSFRGEVLANGELVGTKPLMTEAGDTQSCHNPPIDDCTHAEVMAIVAHYGVIGTYYGPAKFIGEDDPQNQSVDDTNDVTQEQADKADVVALASSITAAL